MEFHSEPKIGDRRTKMEFHSEPKIGDRRTKMEFHSEPTINDLSDDVLVNILCRVKQNGNVSQVCHRWCELREAFTTELNVGPRPLVDVPEGALPALWSRFVNLTTLTLYDRGYEKAQINDQSLLSVARGCMNLTDLSLNYCRLVTDAGIASIARLPRLPAVFLFHTSSVTSLGLLALANGCVSLKCLRIHALRLEGASDWLEAIGEHREVETLSIQWCTGVESSDLARLGSRGWDNLRKIYFTSPTPFTQTELGWRVAYSEGTEVCPNLEKLAITQCSLMSMTGWLWILSQCKALRRVKIHDCLGVQDDNIRVLTENNLQLSSLNWVIPASSSRHSYHRDEGPTNASFFNIAKNCHQLQKLKLNFHRELIPGSTRSSSECGVVAIVESCAKLEKLAFSEVRVSALGRSLTTAIGRSPSLQEVEFYLCGDLDDDMILDISPNLRKLSLRFCHRLTDACLNRFGNANRLNYLKVWECEGITQKGASDATVKLNWGLYSSGFSFRDRVQTVSEPSERDPKIFHEFVVKVDFQNCHKFVMKLKFPYPDRRGQQMLCCVVCSMRSPTSRIYLWASQGFSQKKIRKNCCIHCSCN